MINTYKLNFKGVIAALGALLVAAFMLTPATAAAAESAPFTMAVIVDDAHGREIVYGKFDRAIEKITRHGDRSPDRFADQNNLCVAYAKTKEIGKARVACDAAIALARSKESRATRRNNKRSLPVLASRSNLAIALSNRGVLLATAGDAELARKDFVAALDFQTRFSSSITANLDRLDETVAPDA